MSLAEASPRNSGPAVAEERGRVDEPVDLERPQSPPGRVDWSRNQIGNWNWVHPRVGTKPGGRTRTIAEPGRKNQGQSDVGGDGTRGGWVCQAG